MIPLSFGRPLGCCSVLILVIKERVIPRNRVSVLEHLPVLILVIKERVIPLYQLNGDESKWGLNPSHKGKGDSIKILRSWEMSPCLNPSHKGKGDSKMTRKNFIAAMS